MSVVCLLTLLHPIHGASQEVHELLARVSTRHLRSHVLQLRGQRMAPVELGRSAAYIARRLGTYGYRVERHRAFEGDNVRAVARDAPNERTRILIGAHYDTVEGSPGVDDNALGVAALLELARVLAPIDREGMVEFVAFSEEEIDRWGSVLYAAALRDNLQPLTGAIVLDQIGYTCTTPGCQAILPDIPSCLDVSDPIRSTGDFIAAVGNDSSRDLLNSFVLSARQFVTELPIETGTVFGSGRCLSITRLSDHASFWDVGYPAILITDTGFLRSPHYHQPTDTLSTINLDFARQVTQSILATVLMLLNSNPPPPKPTPPATPTPTNAENSILYSIVRDPNDGRGKAVAVHNVTSGQETRRIALAPDFRAAAIRGKRPRLFVLYAELLEGLKSAAVLRSVDVLGAGAERTTLIPEIAPYAVAVTNDGETVYVIGLQTSPNATIVAKLDALTLDPIGSVIEFSGNLVGEFALSSDGHIGYLGRGDHILAFDTRTGQELGSVRLELPAKIIVGLRDLQLYSTELLGSGVIHAISTTPLALSEKFLGPRATLDAAVDGARRLLYVTAGGPAGLDGRVAVAPYRIAALDAITGNIVAISDVPLDNTPLYRGLVVDSNGQALYVGSCTGVLQVEPETLTVARVIPGTERECHQVLSLATSSPTDGQCAGDCGGNGQVTVADLLKMVDIGLGMLPLANCRAGDSTFDSQVAIDDLLNAVRNALDGCPA